MFSTAIILKLNVSKEFDKKYQEFNTASSYVTIPAPLYSEDLLTKINKIEDIEKAETKKGIYTKVTINFNGSNQEQNQIFYNMDEKAELNNIKIVEESTDNVQNPIYLPSYIYLNSNYHIKDKYYVEIDEKAVRSYNAMFEQESAYSPQTVVGWNLQPDILIHGSPCQDFSIAGHQGKATAADGRINKGKGADEGSGTRSSLMWETVHIIEQMGEWKPTVVIWENVKNVLSKHMVHNFNRYLSYMEKLGYSNNYKVLDCRDYGIPQARERCFTVSILGDNAFDFELMEKRPMKNISNFLEYGDVPDCYLVTQPSVYSVIGKKGIRRATIIKDYVNTITTRQDRTPAQVIDLGGGKYRYLTELECWRLMGYSDDDFYAAEATCRVEPGKMNRTLYHQAGNSIPVPIFESMFSAMLNSGIIRKEGIN